MDNASDVTDGWLEIAVTTPRPAMAEVVFEHFGAAAITALDAGDTPTVELSPHVQLPFDVTQIVGLFTHDVTVANVKHSLLQALGADVTIAVRDVARQDWAQAWMAHHPPLHFGARLWVAPHAATVATHGHDDVIVRLDPGLAFGTGTHPTTALCLAWLAQADVHGCTVLDYGCGSGILAVAAALLGARRVCAVDIDAQAIRATRDNAAANDCAARIDTPTIDAIGATQFDIVLANILANPLIGLAPTLTAHCQPEARLVLSGLLQRQTPDVRAAYDNHFNFAAPAQQAEWMRLDGVRKAADSD